MPFVTLRVFVIPSGEIRVGNPRDIPTMKRLFQEARDYLEAKEKATFNPAVFSNMNLLVGTSTFQRLRVALYDWEASVWKEETFFLVSGGKLRPDREQVVSDAMLMAVYLLLRGVPRERIILEEQAADTDDNARFCAELIQDRMLKEKSHDAEISIFSEKNHLRRFKFAFWFMKLKWSWMHMPHVHFHYVATGPDLSLVGVIKEWGFLLLLMPFGRYNPLAAFNRSQRRANGQS